MKSYGKIFFMEFLIIFAIFCCMWMFIKRLRSNDSTNNQLSSKFYEEVLDDDEKDFFETSWFRDYDYKELEGNFLIDYIDPSKLKTSRDIELKHYYFDTEQNDFFIQARCHLRKANRTFRVSRIQKITNTDTGELALKNEILDFFANQYKQSPYYIKERLVKKHNNEIDCLVYISRLDGRFTKKEKDIILDYLISISQANVDHNVEKYLYKHINFYEETSQINIKKNLKILKDDQKVKEELVTAIDKILNSTKTINPVKVAGAEIMLATLGN
jgi:hypothetical protein